VKLRWLALAWALVGAPATIALVGLLGPSTPFAILAIGGLLVPGLCIGSGVGALLWTIGGTTVTRVAVAATYGAAVYAWAAFTCDPVAYVASATVWVTK
jgi:hypothetical protein